MFLLKLPCNSNCRIKTLANPCLSISEMDQMEKIAFTVVVLWCHHTGDYLTCDIAWGCIRPMPGTGCKSVMNSLCDVLPMYELFIKLPVDPCEIGVKII